MTQLNWYPGHMAKTKRVLQEQLTYVDVIIEIIDARAAISSRNPDIQHLAKTKRHIICLTKADLADPNVTAQWQETFEKKPNSKVIIVNAQTGQNCQQIEPIIHELTQDIQQKRQQKNIKPRPIRAMVVGIPNVGKSSLINRLTGTAQLKAENRPAVTQAIKWLKVSKALECCDSPGMLWPKLDSKEVGYHLAFIGSIRQTAYDPDEIGYLLLKHLIGQYPALLKNRYGIELEDPAVEIVMEAIGKSRGYMQKQGEIDESKTLQLILNEFRAGKLGRISLERPQTVLH